MIKVIGTEEQPPQLELFDIAKLIGYIREQQSTSFVYRKSLCLDRALRLHAIDWYEWFMGNVEQYWEDLDFMINTCIVEEYREEVKNALI